MNKIAQHVNEKDYPSVRDVAAYVESLKLYLANGVVKDPELCSLIENLPSPQNILKRLSNEEIKIIFQTVGYLWKKITKQNPIAESKFENKPETLLGNYWMLQKGILLEGPNHYSIVKQNLDLFRSLLDINAFALHEKLASPPNELIKLILDNGGLRIFVNQKRKSYFQMTDDTYGKWGARKVRKYDFPEKIVKIIDKTAPYKGWKSGILVLLK